MTNPFQKATLKQAKLRLGITGPSGSGKTLAALMIAKGIGGNVAVIDTEHGSASLYSRSFDFDVINLDPPYSPERFIELLKAAESGGYGVVIIDSATHEWDGIGGCLEINEALAQAKFRGNTWSAWNETTPRHRAFIDAIIQSPCHVICTARSKTETVQGEDKKVRKVGMKTEQRAGFEYDMSLIFEIEHEKHLAVLTKGRLFDAPASVRNALGTPHLITPKTGELLMEWLSTGEIAPAATPGTTTSGTTEINWESEAIRLKDRLKVLDVNIARDLWSKHLGKWQDMAVSMQSEVDRITAAAQ